MDHSATAPAAPALRVDLIDVLRHLLAARWLIIGATLLAGGAGAYWAKIQPDRFEAVIRVSIINPADPGGVSPDDRRAPEVLTLVEHGFVLGTEMDNFRYVTLAKLRSRAFTLLFMDTHNVFRDLYPDQWDEEAQDWRDGFTPDRGASFERFHEQVRMIRDDDVTGIVSIAMRWTDPVRARQWANDYVALFNNYMRNSTLDEVERRQAFLSEELADQRIVELQQSIYRLIEAQTAMAMLAKGREEYSLDVIDPATRPYDRFSPARRRIVLYSGFAGAMLSTFAVIGLMVGRRVWALIQQVQPATEVAR